MPASLFANQPGRSPFLAELLADPQYQMALKSYAAGSATTPVQSGMEGLARALQGLAGGYFAGQAKRGMEGREGAYNETLAKALAAAEPWRNPDVVVPKGEDVRPVPVGTRQLAPGEIATGTGGIPAMAAVLANAPPEARRYTAPLGLQLSLSDIGEKRKLEGQYALKGFEHGLSRATAADQRAYETQKTAEQRAYERSPEYLAGVGRKAAAGREPLSDRMQLAQAGKAVTNIEVKGEQKGLEAAWKNTSDMWKEAQTAAMGARKNAIVYRRMEDAAKKFRSGTTAGARIAVGALAQDVFGIKTDGVAEGQLFEAMGKRLELLATPRGQGQITENERTIIRGTIPNVSKTPEGVVAILEALRELDKFDLAYERVFTESARRHGGSPNPVEVAEALAALGPAPLPDFAQQPQAAPSAGKSTLSPAEQKRMEELERQLGIRK